MKRQQEETTALYCRLSQDIATILWENKLLTPSACKVSKGIGVAKVSETPYCWESATVAAILENVAYIGITESFKSTRLGFKRLTLPLQNADTNYPYSKSR